MNTEMTGFRFQSPEFLWIGLGASVGILLLLFWFERREKRDFQRFFHKRVLARLLNVSNLSEYWKRKRVPAFCYAAGALFLFIALARPQFGTEEQELASQTADFVVLLDVSNSMLAEDVSPSRLRKAKHMIRKLVEGLAGDRFGLVVFAGSSFPAIPLTTDQEYFLESLEVMDTSVVQNQGSQLTLALEEAIELLKRGTDETEGYKALFIFSDGEAREEKSASAEKLARSLSFPIYAFGVGTPEGAPIRIGDHLKKDSGGKPILTKLQSESLQKIAEISNGEYHQASTLETEIEDVIEFMKAMKRNVEGSRKWKTQKEYFQIPLLLSILCLGLALCWLERRQA